jgi:indolepyruvate ferredoxin oxidoreductase
MRSEAAVTLATVSLDDKYALDKGRVYLTGIQALVRLPLMQQARDRASGLNTGGFISGYRGSPLGGYDTALHGARAFLEKHNIRFHPGLNEDMAATSLWGSQQVGLFDGATVDGVFGIWYGKGPGVDRCGDVFKHANAAGTSPRGGVLAIMGDDHGASSSTLAHQSEQVMAAAMMPILNPATLQDYLDFGLLGFALSRFSGCWVGFKAVGQTVETSGSVAVDIARPEIFLPADFAMPEGGLNIRRPDPPLEQEKRLHGPRMAAVAAFARANALDRVVIEPRAPRLGIAAAGKSFLDVREALDELGLSDDDAAALGIRLYKIGLVWPLEVQAARRFADGLTELLVVEEKRGFIEDQFAKALFNLPQHPRLIGKQDDDGNALLPSEGEQSPILIARVIAERLLRLGVAMPALEQRVARLRELETRAARLPPLLTRSAYFCSGCPHNTSTNVPDGSRALAGIGCHSLTIFMPERRTHLWSHMGGEGAAWIGQAPFTSEPHVFQNIGDGTYSHSGLLAIRAAAASGVNITYKILFNDAVAMTGGQRVEGGLTVPQITHQVAAEGAKKIIVVSDEPDKYPPDAGFPPGVEFRHRDQLDAVQRELREIPGLTILVYDQTCAAEKRRRRKRGTFPDPQKRVFINEAVCEGCGDCSTQSNCVSVQPVETELGRKRRIDQSACNKDFSCLKGFCPSFVTVHGGAPRKAKPPVRAAATNPADGLAPPAPLPIDRPYGILVTGIGGTGVITIGALLGMAAHLEGKGCTVLDSTGLSQKNGAVMSHVRIAATPEELHAARIVPGAARLVLACDMVVAAGAEAFAAMENGVTRAVVNSAVTPTAGFVTNNEIDFQEAAMQRRIRDAVGAGNVEFVAATTLATAVLGDSIATNLFMLGYAFQKGLIPLGLDAIMQAIALNGVAVAKNQETFAWGRRAAVDPSFVEDAARPALRAAPAPIADLGTLVEHRAQMLTAYQDAAYAARYRAVVQSVAVAESARLKGMTGLAETVARTLYRLMAYKDEYEVARLYADPEFRRSLEAQFEGKYRIEFNLAPPLFAKRDPATGRLIKRAYGPWLLPAFRVLAKLKRLRGTWLDPFGHTAERRMEQGLVREYEALVRTVVAALTQDNHAIAIELASAAQRIRGYGHIKQQSVAQVKATEARLLARLQAPAQVLAAAE